MDNNTATTHTLKALYFVDRGLSMMPGETVVLLPMAADLAQTEAVLSNGMGANNPMGSVMSMGVVEIESTVSADGHERECSYKLTPHDAFPQIAHRPDKDRALIEYLIENPMGKVKYIRTMGYNRNADELIFIFDGKAFHDRTARLLTRGLVQRCCHAGFVLFGSGNIEEMKLGGSSDTLGVSSKDEDDEVMGPSDTNLARELFLA